MEYYFTDWITFLCNLVAMWFIGSGKKYGFIFGTIACVADFIFGIIVNSQAIMISAILFAIFNIRAYIKWKISENGYKRRTGECISIDKPKPNKEKTKSVE